MKAWHVRRYSLGGLIGIRWERSWSRLRYVGKEDNQKGCMRIWVNLIPFFPMVFYQLYTVPDHWKYCDWQPGFSGQWP